MHRRFLCRRGITRRELMRAGLFGAAALCALGGVPAHSVFGHIARAAASPRASEERILVVLALSGGNDGLNTVVPYGDDAYYRHRPTIGLKPERLLRLDHHFALNPGMVGFERLWWAGDLAIVHGCGYDNPSFSHAAAMATWHTAAPGRGAGHGWLGRLADGIKPGGAPALAIGAKPALAIKGRDHAPAEGAFALAREACADYRTPIDYGPAPLGLPEIAALIAADAPARLYYTACRGNAFDTHVHQNELHRHLLACTADAIAAFMADMARIGRADRVVVLLFSEFGRKVAENPSLGTDHGTAGPMFVIGRPMRGGHYGAAPSLTDLTEDGNLRHTVDFRRVYATAAAGWLGHPDTRGLLGEDFEPFAMFG